MAQPGDPAVGRPTTQPEAQVWHSCDRTHAGTIRCRTVGEHMRKASVTWLGALVGLGLGAATGQAALAAENLRLCTGSPGKAYLKVGQKLADLVPKLTAGALTI